ncbi:hypothetical protein EPI10_001520 [Gossypium australe]|uniref:Uncharacterized protein n=1 Tax=Gossypium australe TaxID=47621 RepID=A0A5B6VBB7_9ROSI|nr:hypothetical protein EPI10_001520 [Gossypium australe]
MLKYIIVNGFNDNLIGQQLNQFENISCEYCGYFNGFNGFVENFPSNIELKYYMGNQNWNVINGLSNSSMTSRPNYLSEYFQQVQQPPPTKSSCALKMGQLANEFRHRPQRVLSSNTENPRSTRKERCKVVSLRSGKALRPKVVKVEDEFVVYQDKEEVQLSIEIPLP